VGQKPPGAGGKGPRWGIPKPWARLEALAKARVMAAVIIAIWIIGFIRGLLVGSEMFRSLFVYHCVQNSQLISAKIFNYAFKAKFKCVFWQD
jgi:hypothetical protein